MNENKKLTGKKALVTGAGRGLGRAIALKLAHEGAAVAVWARSVDELEATAALIRAEGGTVFPMVADVSDIPTIARHVSETSGMLGGLDILVNNAGVNRQMPALEVTEEAWDAVININLKGMFFIAQAVARDMITRAGGDGRSCGGRIINMSSSLAGSVLENRVPYLASKGGVNLVTRALALELAPYGITVNAVGPAIVDTAMTRGMGASSIHPKMLFGRLIAPAEIAAAVAYFASPSASMTTGQVLYVDAGWTIH